MHITWDRNAFRGNEISIYIPMSPPGLRRYEFTRLYKFSFACLYFESTNLKGLWFKVAARKMYFPNMIKVFGK